MRRRLPRPQQLAVLAVALVLVAASCGKDTASTTTTTAKGGTTNEQLGDPVEGGSLTYGLEAETSDGWCLPKSQLAASGIMVANQMYDSLFQYDANFKPQPYLAQSYSWNPTYTALTIKLRPGIKFSDGSDLTSSVVKLNLDVTRGEATAAAKTGVAAALFIFVYQDIASVDAPDPLTVVVNTKRAWPGLVDIMAQGRNGIIGEKQLMDKAPGDTTANTLCAKNVIGTGPFSKRRLTRTLTWLVG